MAGGGDVSSLSGRAAFLLCGDGNDDVGGGDDLRHRHPPSDPSPTFSPRSLGHMVQ